MGNQACVVCRSDHSGMRFGAAGFGGWTVVEPNEEGKHDVGGMVAYTLQAQCDAHPNATHIYEAGCKSNKQYYVECNGRELVRIKSNRRLDTVVVKKERVKQIEELEKKSAAQEREYLDLKISIKAEALEKAETELMSIAQAFERAKNAREKFENYEFGELIETQKVVLLGKTGSGKSTLGNRFLQACGDNGTFATSASCDSETSEISAKCLSFGSRAYCIVDTPGFEDTKGKDEDKMHRDNLMEFLFGIGDVHAFILVRPVCNIRLTETDKNVLTALVHNLGQEFWNNLVVVCSFVDDSSGIETFAKVKDNLCKALYSLGAEIEIPICAVGNKQWTSQLTEIFQQIQERASRPFVCEALRAPKESLQVEMEAKQTEVSKLKADLDNLKDRKTSLGVADDS